MSGTSSILFVDAYDSFSNNIIALLHSCVPSADIVVVHIDTDVQNEFQVDVETFIRSFQAVVLGPGPGHPANKADIGLFENVWKSAEQYRIPVLGICLGFQSLCIRNGCSISRMHMPCHGQTKSIRTSGLDIFADSEKICAMNYNSLAVRKSEFETEDNISRPASSGTDSSTSSRFSDFVSIGSCLDSKPNQLELLAWDDDGYVMAVRHRLLPFYGFQFHPESCMSQGCDELIKRWWSRTEQYNEMHRPQEIPAKIQNGPRDQRSVQSLPEADFPSYGLVSWQMTKVKNLTPSHIAELCHESGGQNATAMLESTAKGRFGIYAFTDDVSELLTYHNGLLTSSLSNQLLMSAKLSPKDALNYLERRVKASACFGGCPKIPFWGGLIGYLSYEMGLDLINVASDRPRDVPDFNFVCIDRSVVFDNKTNNICIQSIQSNDDVWINEMKDRIKKLDRDVAQQERLNSEPDLTPILKSAEKSLPEHDTYTSLIQQCQANLRAGQSYELCLTSEATIDLPDPTPKTSYSLYKNLRKHNPVPYAAYLHFPSPAGNQNLDTTILSSSPELFLSQSRTGTMDMIPMKGTVQRTPTTKIEDVIKILHTPKETAENLMIADLIRHDLYAVVGTKPYPWFTASPDPSVEPQFELTSQPSTTLQPQPQTSTLTSTRSPLSIPALNSIQTYATVYQLTSHIRAHPPPHLFSSSTTPLSAPDPRRITTHNHSALPHVLPPGSMTGAPKKRSCQILSGLEQRNRGVYSGIIGYMCVSGSASWSVAIRTAFSAGSDQYERAVVKAREEEKNCGCEGEQEWQKVQKEKRRIWRVGAGGAVTVLSDVEGEWEEMMGKMRNVLRGFTSPT